MSVDYPNQNMIVYNAQTQERALRSLICSPFTFSLFNAMRQNRVAISEITGNRGVENNYTKRSLSELITDNELVWLIQVGVLRREVDGQGITDSFRLTPLGRQLVEQSSIKPWRQPTFLDIFYEVATRWLRLPF